MLLARLSIGDACPLYFRNPSTTQTPLLEDITILQRSLFSFSKRY
jgi:hypothetical protein